MQNKGQSMWTSLIIGLFGLLAVSMLFIILQQIYTYDINPDAIAGGVDATNLNYIDIAWKLFLPATAIAFIFAMITAGRESRRGYGLE